MTAAKNAYKVYISARVKLQLHSLNAAGAVGNYTKLQEGYVIHNGEVIPVPIITGNALKNWHARKMSIYYVTKLTGKQIHERHFTDMWRVTRDVIKNENDPENDIVSNCAICDVHGYLIAERDVPKRQRHSLIEFSFAVPTEDFIGERIKFVVIHNRVVPMQQKQAEKKENKEKEEEKAEEKGQEKEVGMRIFKREYGTAIYAWEAVLDIAQIGRSQYRVVKVNNNIVWLGEEIVSDKNELNRRIKATILAFDAPLTGDLGASTARALPISRPVELVAIVTNSPMPRPLHPYYSNWKDDLGQLLEVFSERVEKVFVFGISKDELLKSSKSGQQGEQKGKNSQIENKISPFNTWYELIESLAEYLTGGEGKKLSGA
jgi:CRISPR-associated protein Cst2